MRPAFSLAPNVVKLAPRTQTLHALAPQETSAFLPVNALGSLGLRRERVAALETPGPEHLAPTFGRHARAKAVRSRSMSFLGLVRSFGHILFLQFLQSGINSETPSQRLGARI
jgi:hypothetical protein